jgi:hypothetical protein
MLDEIWVPVKSHPLYEVSNLGRVRNITTGDYKRTKPTALLMKEGQRQSVSWSYYRLMKEHFPYEWIKELEDDEECKEHSTHKGYFITTQGRVFSLHSYKWCKVGLVKNFPYPRITIHSAPKLIHILLAETFIPNPHNHPDVLHQNDVKTDYRLSNLRWGNDVMNWEDALRNGRR